MKRFLVILGITALVWVGVSLSEENDYPVRVRVEYIGYDTVRYALLQADTLLPVQAHISGFNAMLLGISQNTVSLEVPVEVTQNALPVGPLTDRVRQSILGAKSVMSSVDSIHFSFAERSHRDYLVNLDQLNISFADQYGLYGEPVLTPSVVTLYGPKKALDDIQQVNLQPAEILGIKESGTYPLMLDPVWKQYADVRPSCQEVNLYLPVEAYVEKEYMVPVIVKGADTALSVKVYPPQVTVHAWVAQRDLLREPEFTVAVFYDELLSSGGRLSPQLLQFPGYIRLRSIEPNEVQCVVIK